MILQDPWDDRQAKCNILHYSCHETSYSSDLKSLSRKVEQFHEIDLQMM